MHKEDIAMKENNNIYGSYITSYLQNCVPLAHCIVTVMSVMMGNMLIAMIMIVTIRIMILILMRMTQIVCCLLVST